MGTATAASCTAADRLACVARTLHHPMVNSECALGRPHFWPETLITVMHDVAAWPPASVEVMMMAEQGLIIIGQG